MGVTMEDLVDYVFRSDELEQLKSLTSLNYVKFTMSTKEYLPEKFLLFKACRIFEDHLLKVFGTKVITPEEKRQRDHELQAIYVQLGNVNLLAEDFARSLSAYQHAYRLNKAEFWRDASALYGLAVTYIHFRAYKPAIELFCQLIYCHPHIEVATEVHARLGIAWKCLEDFPLALKHLLIALDAAEELQLVTKYQLRFHIAHCYDGSGDFRRAVEDYRRLVTDHERNLIRLPIDLLAIIHRQLGWIALRSREKEFKEDVRQQKLREAEQQLTKARELVPTDSKTNCYLGLCYSEQAAVASLPASSAASAALTPTSSANTTVGGAQPPTSANGGPAGPLATTAGSNSATGKPPVNPAVAGWIYDFRVASLSVSLKDMFIHSECQQKQQQLAQDKAQDAFVSYRSAIDSDESDANTWCSIGVLYQQQSQALDALQAFACAVQLNDKHSAAWTELGRLYESHRQYIDCLHCYRKALQHNPVHPEVLRTRVAILEKEFGTPGAATLLNNYLQNAASQTGGGSSPQLLPPLENAWQLGIPAQVRQRLTDLHKQQENRYREGSPLWKMSELVTYSMRQSFYDLDPTQRQILQVLKINKEQLADKELKLLNELEDRYNIVMSNSNVANAEDSSRKPKRSPVGSPAVSGRNSAANESTKQKASPLRAHTTNGDELKLRISRTPTSTAAAVPSTSSGGFPNISEDDLADLLGDAVNDDAKGGRQPKSPRDGVKRCANGRRTNRDGGSASPSLSANEPLPADSSTKRADHSSTEQAVNVSALELQEQRISSTAGGAIDELPPAFSLLAPVHVPITVSSAEMFEACKKRRMRSDDYRPIFDECVAPPRPPEPPKRPSTKEALLLKTPLILVENAREALTTELQNFCYNSPIALVHGLTAALKIDLSQFSTKSLIQTAPDHEVEVRTQYKMPGDANLDHLGNSTWLCHSTKSFTTVSRYGQYQAESFRYSLKEETEKLKQQTTPAAAQSQPATSTVTPLRDDSPVRSGGTPLQSLNGSAAKRRKTNCTNGATSSDSSSSVMEPMKMLKFGTNVDLSDDRKFYAQLKELNKMPAFCRISAACNMLTHLGHTVLGMNTVQLYMKVPGCRTPGHLENNSFASININIGPGECEWFGVPYDYWPVIEQMCKERNIDFLKGAWWPSVQDLINADVPWYRFTQKAGDMVWVGGGCVHWVQATGWCNNVAWNVGPMTAKQLDMALYAYEWNRLNSYRSLVPMQHLAWQLARDVRFSNQEIFNATKNILIRSLAYCRIVADFVERNTKMPIKFQSRQKGETAHYCYLCDIEVFNLLFVKEISSKFRVFCVECARKNNIDDYVVLQQISFDELAAVFDRFQLHPSKAALIC